MLAAIVVVVALAGASAELLFGQETRPESVRDDWVAVHEFFHLGMPSFVGEGHWLEEGLATVEDIDKAIRLGFNHPMGPFELSDFNGIDIFVHVTDSLVQAFGERFRPTVGVRNMVAAGRLGRKSGRGFYRYDAQGHRVEPE